MEHYSFENLSWTYPDSDTPALSEVSFQVEKGDFVVVCGASGSGKSTLLHAIKEKNPSFGFVLQDPAAQIVTDKVYHELAFGMENKGIAVDEMERKIAEIVTYFGMEDWLDRDTMRLSGGEKQQVNLASVLVENPEVILLDEPSSQLDPMAAVRFLEMCRRLNEQLGLTMILVEQRLEEVLPVCDKILVLEEGKVAAYDTVQGVFEKSLAGRYKIDILSFLPSFVRLYRTLSERGGHCPRNVKESRRWFADPEIREKLTERLALRRLEREQPDSGIGEATIECRNLFFRYEKNGKDILRSVQAAFYPGKIYGLVGGNGCGKSTFLRLLGGSLRAYHGKLRVRGQIACLPQEPKYMFIEERVGDVARSEEARERFGLMDLLERHPYDVSGGQMQRVAMAELCEKEADIYLFDEPTKGLDPKWKERFAQWLRELADGGRTVLVVSHDVEWTAAVCQQMSLFFQGRITSPVSVYEFMKNQHFYTTNIHKIVGESHPMVVSERDYQ